MNVKTAHAETRPSAPSAEDRWEIGSGSGWRLHFQACLRRSRLHFQGMTRPESIQHIREACKTVALQFMKIHPALPGLQDAETQADCLKALHEMTVHLETIKKKIGRLEKRDDSSLL